MATRTQNEKAVAARKKAFAGTGLSYSQYGATKFDPAVTKQTVEQAMNGKRQIDRVCKHFARYVMRKPLPKAFPEFYS